VQAKKKNGLFLMLKSCGYIQKHSGCCWLLLLASCC